MGVRRAFIPPLVDTYQDMLFILMGKRDAERGPEVGFMTILEWLVCLRCRDARTHMNKRLADGHPVACFGIAPSANQGRPADAPRAQASLALLRGVGA